jgi:hypothetical protein
MTALSNGEEKSPNLSESLMVLLCGTGALWMLQTKRHFRIIENNLKVSAFCGEKAKANGIDKQLVGRLMRPFFYDQKRRCRSITSRLVLKHFNCCSNFLLCFWVFKTLLFKFSDIILSDSSQKAVSIFSAGTIS